MAIKGKLATKGQDGQKVVLDNEYGDGYVHDVKSHDLLEQILIVAKKIEYHLSIASDTELKDNDV